MPRYLCTTDNVTNQILFKAGQVYDLISNPNAAFFQTFSDDIKREILGGFQRDLDGTLYLPSGGWDDLTYPVTALNPLGAASDPTRSNVDGLLEFSATATNMIAGVAHLPHRKALRTKIAPHIHWYPATNAAGNVVWKFEYKCCDPSAAIPAAYTEETITVAAPGAVNHIITRLTQFDPQESDLGMLILWRLSRLGGDAADTYGGVARLMEFDIHFWQDSIGSGQEYSK